MPERVSVNKIARATTLVFTASIFALGNGDTQESPPPEYINSDGSEIIYTGDNPPYDSSIIIRDDEQKDLYEPQIIGGGADSPNDIDIDLSPLQER